MIRMVVDIVFLIVDIIAIIVLIIWIHQLRQENGILKKIFGPLIEDARHEEK